MRQKIQSNYGFILFTVLIFLQLFSLIAMESVASLTESKRSIKLLARQRHAQLTAMTLISQLTTPLALSCVETHYQAALLPRAPLSWWQSHACHGAWQGGDYYYYQEPLALAVCNDKNKPVRYDRNTLLYLPGMDFYSAILYQSVITSINSSDVPCQGEPKTIPLGLQMLRQLY